MNSDWICRDCAIEKGCTWPKGHLATTHEGKCGECDKVKTVTNVNDWIGPNGKRRGAWD